MSPEQAQWLHRAWRLRAAQPAIRGWARCSDGRAGARLGVHAYYHALAGRPAPRPRLAPAGSHAAAAALLTFPVLLLAL